MSAMFKLTALETDGRIFLKASSKLSLFTLMWAAELEELVQPETMIHTIILP